ncbi:hypothetical protein GGR54DRAFT_650602 [Hypoxylon sp. NC1633]|nr:hypothetical protein GGR54DRAFT_650602 [Hypoxylon sp. NC1633]
MAESRDSIHLNGSLKPQAPMHPPGPGDRQTGSGSVPMHTQLVHPRAGLLVNDRRGPSVVISDVSRDLLTIDDMREELTEYATFRFEKMPNSGPWRVAEGDSTADTASEQEHAHPVLELKSLSPVLQRQINAAHEYLVSQDPEPVNYHWDLAQLDHQLREIDPNVVATGRNHAMFRKRRGLTRRPSRSGTSGRRRRSYERISLTAYFKRIPRLSVDIPTIYEARKRSLFPQKNHTVHPTPGPDLRTPPPGVGPRRVGASFAPGGPVNSPPPTQPQGPNKAGPGRTIPINQAGASSKVRGEDVGRDHRDFRVDFDCSDCTSSDESLNSQTTPITPQSADSPRKNGDNRRHHGEIGVLPRNTSIRHDRISPRRHAKQEQHSNLKNGMRMAHTAEPSPPHTSAIDIDRAYLAGMRDARDNARFTHQRAFDESLRSRPRPHIIHSGLPSTPPYGRYMANSAAERHSRRRNLDDEIIRFGRLSLDEEEEEEEEDEDEDGYDTVLRREDARRRREIEYLLQRGSVLGDDPFNREVPPYASRDGGRYHEPYVTEASDSDFMPPRAHRIFR